MGHDQKEYEFTSNWRCTGMSVQGQSHERVDKPCQDSQGWAQVNDTLVLACADGAGSAKHAEWGSATAVESAIGHLLIRSLYRHESEDKPEQLTADLGKACGAARRSLVALAKRKQIPLRDLATTFLIAVVRRGYTAAAQIGDGAIVCSLKDHDHIEPLTTPVHGTYINETVFLTQENYGKHLQLKVVEGEARHIALFSDGFEPVAIKYATGQPNTALFEGLFKFMRDVSSESIRQEAVSKLLNGKRIAERSDDDKTLLMATSCN